MGPQHSRDMERDEGSPKSMKPNRAYYNRASKTPGHSLLFCSCLGFTVTVGACDSVSILTSQAMRFETDDQKVWDLMSTAEDEAALQRFGTFNAETLGLCLEKLILG